MSDPLHDPRAQELLRVLPEEVGTLAGKFRTAAIEAQQTATGLNAARHDGHWTGRAAAAFRHAIGRLPAELDRVCTGFDAVSDALTTYDGELTRIKPAFAQVALELEDAEPRLAAAQAAYRTAAAADAVAARNPGSTLATLIKDQHDVTLAHGPLVALSAHIERLRMRGMALLEEFSAARGACHAAIRAAGRSAPVAHHRGGAGVTVIGGGLRRPRPVYGGGHVVHDPASSIPPGAAREKVNAMVDRADSLIGTPYVWGGGHGSFGGRSGLDCSGFVSTVLHAGGYLRAPESTEGFAAQPGIAAGRGRYVTIYDRTNAGNNEHVIIDLNGQFYEEGGGPSNGGAPQAHKFRPSPEYLASFNTILHPEGL
ncbi:MAG: NlpC/P60 family protein [Actinomycetota bacterium]|nr:NlpC/P60 family protein [Actinomycetota bacterium]